MAQHGAGSSGHPSPSPRRRHPRRRPPFTRRRAQRPSTGLPEPRATSLEASVTRRPLREHGEDARLMAASTAASSVGEAEAPRAMAHAHARAEAALRSTSVGATNMVDPASPPQPSLSRPLWPTAPSMPNGRGPKQDDLGIRCTTPKCSERDLHPQRSARGRPVLRHLGAATRRRASSLASPCLRASVVNHRHSVRLGSGGREPPRHGVTENILNLAHILGAFRWDQTRRRVDDLRHSM